LDFVTGCFVRYGQGMTEMYHMHGMKLGGKAHRELV
jgi:hypothetical protein